jgi:flagellar motor switch protein FliN
MSRKPPIIGASSASFLDALAGELQRLLSADQTQPVTVSWNVNQPDAEVADRIWWSCALSVDPGCRIYAGADRETWQGIGGDETPGEEPQPSWFALLTQSIQQAAKTRFGALVSCTDLGISEDAPGGWSRVSVSIRRDGNSKPGSMSWVLSPELAAALGGEDQDGGAAGMNPPATNALDLLQHVEMPVSVSFGRTHMRLKDLLGLANGSVVRLDRELGDEVEIRVNNSVIARGEVVAVDGNYGVRILEMASTPSAQGIRGALRAVR